jgi:leader peptidase (prepilin peptidase)/N-methyltransferase
VSLQAAHAVVEVAAFAVLAGLAAWDLARRRLPLPLNRALLMLGILSASTAGGLVAALQAVAAAACCAAPLAGLRLAARGRGEAWRLGGGDIRLAAGLGAWLGFTQGLAVLALGAFAASVGGLAVLAWRSVQPGAARARTRLGLPLGATCAGVAMLVRIAVATGG